MIPAATDSVVFQAATLTDSIVDAAFAGVVADMTIQAGYFGNITVARDLQVTNTLTKTSLMGLFVIDPDKTLSAHVVNLSNGTRISGPGTLQVVAVQGVGGTMTVDNVQFLGPRVEITQDSTLDIAGNVTFDTGAMLDNAGTVTWNDGDINLDEATITNLGLFDIASNKTLGGPAGSVFNNHGTMRKSVGGGVTSFHPEQFNNLDLPLLVAQVEVWAGELDFNCDGTHNAPFNAVGALSQISFSGGAHTLQQGADFAGFGMVHVGGGTLRAADPNTTITSAVADFEFALDQIFPPELSGPGSFIISGGFNWSGGKLIDVSVTVSGPTSITGTNDQWMENSSLILQGDSTWTGANNIRMENALITNKGRFEVQNDQQIRKDPMLPSRFENATGGTFIKTGGAVGGQTTIEALFQQVGGNLRLDGRKISFQGGLEQTAGGSTTYLDNGTLIVAGTFSVTAGQVFGFGTIQGNLKIAGGTLDLTTEAATGIVQIPGDYEQTAAGTLKLKVGNNNGAIRDRLQIMGMATLGGALTVSAVTGFPPKAGDSFEIISTMMGGRNGTFDPALVSLPALPGGLMWKPIAYGADTVTLEVNP